MRLTFVAYDAYPLLDPSVRSGIGGAEVRAINFARGLSQRHGVQVSVVVNDRPELPSIVQGMHVLGYRQPKLNGMVKLGRSLAKRVSKRPSRNAFYRDLETDVVLCFGVRNDTASIVRSVRESGKRCVVFLTSDRNIDDAIRQGRRDRGVYGELGHLCRFVVQQSDLVVVQSPYQRDELRSRLGVTGHLIRNPIDLTTHAVASTSDPPTTLLWIGRADTFSKRADLCLQLAQHRPAYRFKMVMNNHDSPTFRQLASSAPANVEIVEQVPFEDIESLFRESHLLLNTSAAEGFPNAFLQAAKYGKPIVSLVVDPGEMLSRGGCGICAEGDFERMLEAVDSLMRESALYASTSAHAVQYVREHHDAVACCLELHDALTRLLPSPRKLAA